MVNKTFKAIIKVKEDKYLDLLIEALDRIEAEKKLKEQLPDKYIWYELDSMY